MDIEQLDQGSYKGVPFLLANGTVSGGNKNALHSYVNSNRQTVENLGTKPRSYPLNIIIPSTNYRQRRDALLAALEDPTPGPLIHPLYGRIENVVAQPYTLNEDLTSLGDGKLSVTFEVDNGPGVPEQAGLTVSQVARANTDVTTAVQANLTDNFNVTPGYLGSFESALAGVQAAAEAFVRSQLPLDNVDGLLDSAGELGGNATALVTDASELSKQLTAQYDEAKSLISDAEAKLAYYKEKFNFGSGNGGATPKTAAQIEAHNNKAVFDSAMRVQALSYSYVAAAQRSYATLEDVQEQDTALEVQYAAVIDLPGTDTATREALADLRQVAQEFLDAAKLTARRIITVRTHPTTARLLAFRYYGDDTQGEDVANLNGGNVSNLAGDVQVLTE
jgi:prophage DNA circulation protein